jgi:hypothetical protein
MRAPAATAFTPAGRRSAPIGGFDFRIIDWGCPSATSTREAE